MTHLRVLGSLEVAGPSEVLAFSPRQQSVLSMLLLAPNWVVPLDRLVAAVWNDHPPTTAKAQIQICVSAIRRAFSRAGVDNPIMTRLPGYLIECSASELDLLAFEGALASARSLAAAGELDEALAEFTKALGMWRGEPLEGVSSRLIRSTAQLLTERRMTAIEEYVDLQLRRGCSGDLIGELRELVLVYPFREHLRAQLMLTLFEAGRRAEALEVFQSARRFYVDQLGIEPGETLVRAQYTVLVGRSTGRRAERSSPLRAHRGTLNWSRLSTYADLWASPRSVETSPYKEAAMVELRRKFDQDFKEGAVRLVRETGRPIAQIAKDLGINAGTLANWVALDRQGRDGGGQLG